MTVFLPELISDVVVVRKEETAGQAVIDGKVISCFGGATCIDARIAVVELGVEAAHYAGQQGLDPLAVLGKFYGMADRITDPRTTPEIVATCQELSGVLRTYLESGR
ncbi:hypothetical protein A2160_01545 [Candidatus Beckwithbacteria bacterium RBG_13_42_9]|uniref:Uncharacterized protein n=1 Tax=Candidatus Beckwithbacteria bacterium RBG_13_42_9 TaxID=1797457 RepID=A0A1F5E920_9BACT|nr:MAG: hypothetical protein A2160_01545 [Candidatus Beckwithbacteria bacterium RBG_13_42_9]